MDHLAVELLEHIFIMACTDGGSTGCSLSRVSKRIKAMSRVARFHSVALASDRAQQVTQFLAVFAAVRAECTVTTPRVRHLYLLSPKRETELPPWSITRDANDTEQVQYSADVIALLTIIAPDLYTFCLVHGLRVQSGLKELSVPVAGMCYPLLQEFTLVGKWKMMRVDGQFVEQYDGTLPPDFPSLTRLHLRLEGRPLAGKVNFPFWIANAPRVTHFRISNLMHWSSEVVELLEDLALNCHSEDIRSFPGLERLVVQTAIGPSPDGKPYIAHDRFLANLLDIRRQAKRPFTLGYAGEPMGWGSLKGPVGREWLDRVSGGPGCWDVETAASGGQGDFVEVLSSRVLEIGG